MSFRAFQILPICSAAAVLFSGCSLLIDPNNELLGGGVTIVDDAGADTSVQPPPPGDRDATVVPMPGEPDAAVVPPGPGGYDPANADSDIWDESAESLEIVATELTFDTTECRASSARSEVREQDSGGDEVFCAIYVRDLTIREDGVLRVSGDLPFAIFASGDVEIAGVLDLSGVGIQPGAGGALGGPWGDAVRGSGPGGGGGGEHEGNYDDGGGGGASFCGRGGPGGAGGTAAGGMPGAVQTPDALEPLRAGSGGGRGRGRIREVRGDTVGNAGRGGAGGGALQISALGNIRISGRVLAGGGGGEEGAANFGAENWGSGGGGGSGGAVLLQAPSISLLAGSVNVGGGGGGGSSSNYVAGGSGVDGRESLAAAPGGDSAGDAYGAAGGNGAGGDSGGVGDRGRGNTREGANGGGGGGGSGCIVLRSDDLRVTDAFAFSPESDEIRQELPLN